MPLITVVFALLLTKSETAKILAISTTLSFNNQEITYPIVKQLAKKGHDVTFLTKNVINENHSENLKEITLKEFSYEHWSKDFIVSEFRKDHFRGIKAVLDVETKVFEDQVKSEAIQKLITEGESFDLLIIPAWFRPANIWSYIYKVPVIKVSSTGFLTDYAESFGVPDHPILYPTMCHQRTYNLSVLETVQELYNRYIVEDIFRENEGKENDIVKKIFGPEVPNLSELKKNGDLLIVNLNSLWDRNRPLSNNIVYIGQGLQKTEKKLPEDIKSFMDSSEDIIFITLKSSDLPQTSIQMFMKVFSRLPYRVVWEYDVKDLKRADNIMIKKKLPWAGVFKHSNLKLIIGSADSQTIQSAIDAGVPILSLPKSIDQWMNVEYCVQYGVGETMEMESDQEEFKRKVVKIIEDPRYRENILNLRKLVNDVPIPPINHAISWIEYVLQHGTVHLRSPASNLKWTEYYEIELICIVLSSVMMFLVCFWCFLKALVGHFEKMIAYQARTNEQ